MTNLAFRKSIRILLASVALSSFAGRAEAQNCSPVAPSEEALKRSIHEAYTKFKNDTGGKNADYIPYLAHVDSNLYGIAIVSTDGRIYKIGDVDYAFSSNIEVDILVPLVLGAVAFVFRTGANFWIDLGIVVRTISYASAARQQPRPRLSV